MLKLFLFAILVASSNAARNLDKITIHLCNVTKDGDLPVEVGNYSIQRDEVKQFIFDFKLADIFKGFLIYNGTKPNIAAEKIIDEKKELNILIKNWKSVSPEMLKKVSAYFNDKLITGLLVNYLKGKFPQKNVTAGAVTTTTKLPILDLSETAEDGELELGDIGELGNLGGEDDDEDVTKELLVDPKYI